MKTFQIMAFATITVLTQAAFADAATACPTEGYAPTDFRIYVDPPSGDAFIRTPCGWRFIRTVEPARVGEAIRVSQVRPADIGRVSGDMGRNRH